MDAMTLPCLPRCQCETCIYRRVLITLRRQLFVKYLIAIGALSEEIHEEPDAKWDFARWAVARGIYTDQIADDDTPMPERLARAWERTEVAA